MDQIEQIDFQEIILGPVFSVHLGTRELSIIFYVF